MAQVTESLVREFLGCIDRGQLPAYTLWEFKQLCYAWQELQRLRQERQLEREAG